MSLLISQLLAIIQNGVTAVNNLSKQMTGSFNNINDSMVKQTAPQGRLTLQSGVPVMTTTQSNKTTLYYTPYVGDSIPLWDGVSLWKNFRCDELSALTTDTTKNPSAIGVGKVNDWFVWNDAGTLRLTHGPDWTSDTVRSAGTALILARGLYLNSVAITNGPAQYRGTYVGTTRSGTTSGLYWELGGMANGGVQGSLLVWNAYNRVQAYATSVDDTSYTYTLNVFREAHGSATNRIYFVTGLAEDTIDVKTVVRTDTVAAAFSYIISGIGLDSSAGLAAGTSFVFNDINVVAIHAYALSNVATLPPQLGTHFVSRLEAGDGLNANTANASLLDFITVSLRM